MNPVYKRSNSSVAPQDSRFLQPDKPVLGVAEVIALIREVLSVSIPRLIFEGELGPVTKASSGHYYFSIKDPESEAPNVLSAVMWRGAAQRLQFVPKEGLRVQVSGAPSLYPASGRFQMVIETMELAGDGVLKRRFEELRAKLQAEGLFELDRKRKLPFFPAKIGVVSSRTGSVIHDIMVTLSARMPVTDVVLAHARVQGEGSVDDVVAALKRLNAHPEVEVIILARGGGSLEDLWTFNEEAVVRAIFASQKPVVAAIGHETDTTLADLVADVRAATPTAAVRAVVPDRVELLRQLQDLTKRLELGVRQNHLDSLQRWDGVNQKLRAGLRRRLELARLALTQAQLRLQKLSPAAKLGERRQRLQGASQRLKAAMHNSLQAQGHLVELRSLRMPVVIERVVSLAGERQHELGLRLQRELGWLLQTRREHLLRIESRLLALDPMQIVQRGYAIVQSPQGTIVSSAKELATGGRVNVVLRDGVIETCIQRVNISK